MTDPTPRRRRGLRVAAGIVGGLLLAAAGTALWVRAVIDRKWAALQSDCETQRAEIERRPATRPVLRGEPVEGSAWADYQIALGHAGSIDQKAQRELAEFFRNSPGVFEEVVGETLAAHRPGLDALQRGARRADRRLPVKWWDGLPSFPVEGQTQDLMFLAAAQSRMLALQRRFLESAELLLDAVQFSFDLVDLDNRLTCIPLTELGRTLSAPGPSPADLAEIDRELDCLDRVISRMEESMIMFLMPFVYELVRQDGVVVPWENLGVEPGLRPGWRFAFSGRLMVARAYEEIREVCREFCDLQDRPYAEEARLDYRDRMNESPNPLVRVAPAEILNMFVNGAINRREARAQIRLLRAAARYRLDGRVPDLDDPFGAKLHWVMSGGFLRIWSVGSDGKDDGGVGYFQTIFGGSSPDIVLELRP